MKRAPLLISSLLLAAISVAAGCHGSATSPPVAQATPPSLITFTVGATPTTETLRYNGYTLSFTLPGQVPPTPKPGALITAALVGSPPTSPNPGVPAPAATRITFPQSIKAPKLIGVSPITPLVYLTVATTALYVFSQAPNFTITSTQPLSIPSGSQAYMALYDPAPASGAPQWEVVTNAGTVDSSGKIITFAGSAKQVIFNPTTFAPPAASLDPYTFALIVIPNGPNPDCAQPQFRNTATPGLTLNLTDSSAINTVLVVYVLQQANPGASAMWMDGTGSFGSQIPVAIPASCYSTTLGSGVTNNPLTIPSGHQGRVYIVEATPPPIGWVPNPFALNGPGSTPTSTENFLYDKIEYNSTNGVIDTTQVDFLGLPLEMSAAPGNPSATPLPAVAPTTCPASGTAASATGIPTAGVDTVGVSQCAFSAIFSSLAADPTWKSLVDVQTYNGHPNIDFRAYNPGDAPYFNPNLLGDVNTIPASCQQYGTTAAVKTYGYVGCLLMTYNVTPQIYDTSKIAGANGSGDTYCVGSDGTANFIATDIGKPVTPNCTSAPPPTPKPTSGPLFANPFVIPAALLTNTDTQKNDAGYPHCNANLVFSAPFAQAQVDQNDGGTLGGHAFSSNDAFLIWKGLVIEMNYGAAMVNKTHPVENTPPAQQFASNNKVLFTDPLSNYFDQLTHTYFNGTYSYGMPYDDGFSWYSGFGVTAPATVSLRINPVPTFVGTAPVLPAATPSPPPCIPYPPDVGSYANPTPNVSPTP